jgi:hypothetical protein
MEQEFGTEDRWVPMTTFTQMRGVGAFLLRFWWQVGKWRNRHGRHHPSALAQLSMIGFARWSLLYELPPKRRLSKPHLLFETNYNGDSDQYLEAFSLVTTKGMRRTWRGTYGMPDVLKVSAFIRFVKGKELKITDYHRAYPAASTKMVRSALELKRLYDDLEPRVKGSSDEQFLREYGDFLVSAQRKDPPPKPPSGKPLSKTGLLTVLTPIKEGRDRDLTSQLRQLQEDWAPPGTHFARWVILDPESTPEERLPVCLVFSAWFDGKAEDYIRSLYKHERIWRHCDGYSGSDDEKDFKQYLLDHWVDPGVKFSGYDGVPLPDIDEAVALAKRVWAFAVANQQLTTPARAGELKRAWLESFA